MNETIKEILKTIKEAGEGNNGYFGIRGDDVSFEIGTCLEDSFDWDYENDRQSKEKLNGTCATKIGYLWFDSEEEDIETIAKALEYHKKSYGYKYTTIVAGTDQEYGADENETIIRNAQVIYKLN